MKHSLFTFFILGLCAVSLAFIYGCGSNATGGGGGGGGGAPFAANVWVSSAGSNDSGTGSFASPFKTIQKATLEVGSNEVIGVMAGTYSGPVNWTTRENVTLRGVSTSTVTIDGGISGRCIFIDNIASIPSPQTITIEGFTIKRGLVPIPPDTGGGIALAKGGITLDIKDVNFIDNGYTDGSDQYNGSALGILASAEGSTLIVEDCSFADNTGRYGGAILTSPITGAKANLKFTDCTFSTCTSEKDGGALFLYSGVTATFESCDFHDNGSGGIGGAIYMACGGKFQNCLFYNNQATGLGPYLGGAVYANGTDRIDFVNCTVVSNEAAGNTGGGIFCNSADDTCQVTNCIMLGNSSASSSPDIDGAHTIILRYSDVGAMPTYFYDGGGILEGVDPKFHRASPPYSAATDFKLTSGSPASVTHGGTTESGTPAADYNGNARSGHNSMGAWQY